MIEIDGSFGEGGGQILRTSVALASVLGKVVRVFNIRAGRVPPGIKAQHLTGLTAASALCGASMEGAKVGSSELVYRPGVPANGMFRFDVGTAGSVTLVLQTLMPILACARVTVGVRLIGGTDVKWSPPIDYVELVTLPMLARMGFSGRLDVFRRGHYPRGGGEVAFVSRLPKELGGLRGLSRGRVVRILGVSHVVDLPRRVAEVQAQAATNLIVERGLPAPSILIVHEESKGNHSPGSGLVLSATSEGGSIVGADGLGEREKSAQDVGLEVAGRLVEEVESERFLDRHMGDMVVPYMALARGVSEVTVSRITKHTLTNVKVAELLAGVRFDIAGSLGEPGMLRVEGLGIGSLPNSLRPKD